MIKSLSVGAALLVTMAAPFLLRPAQPGASRKADQTLVIISPHNETIRWEFSNGFGAYMREKTGQSVRIDWRVPGGTSEIEKLIDSSFRAAFERFWKKDLKRKWTDYEIGDAFNNRRVDPAGDSSGAEARRIFLESNIGIGIDLFFGGGEYPFVVQALSGHLVDSGIFSRRPEWFENGAVIPATFSGERFYDPEKRWIGACLTSFGICYNTDRLDYLRVDSPSQWSDLGDPRFFGEIALADPSKSGSATKAFEMLMQQQMHETLASLSPAGDPSEAIEAEAVRKGWVAGLNLIQRICANARYFTDSSGKIPFDVTQGNAAAGMCIDFYGRTSNEIVTKPDGTSRIHFITPANGSSVSVDPIAMLRGAPHPELALDFIEFLLSRDGQKLWNYRRETPGGPRKISLRRLPVRRDLYAPDYLQFFSDPEVLPFQKTGAFEYVSDWTAPAFGPLQFIIKAMCLDPHDELKAAWRKLVRARFPPEATRAFFDVDFVDYDKSVTSINEMLRSGYKIAEVSLGRKLTSHFRRNYRRAAKLADEGR